MVTRPCKFPKIDTIVRIKGYCEKPVNQLSEIRFPAGTALHALMTSVPKSKQTELLLVEKNIIVANIVAVVANACDGTTELSVMIDSYTRIESEDEITPDTEIVNPNTPFPVGARYTKLVVREKTMSKF